MKIRQEKIDTECNKLYFIKKKKIIIIKMKIDYFILIESVPGGTNSMTKA